MHDPKYIPRDLIRAREIAKIGLPWVLLTVQMRNAAFPFVATINMGQSANDTPPKKPEVPAPEAA